MPLRRHMSSRICAASTSDRSGYSSNASRVLVDSGSGVHRSRRGSSPAATGSRHASQPHSRCSGMWKDTRWVPTS